MSVGRQRDEIGSLALCRCHDFLRRVPRRQHGIDLVLNGVIDVSDLDRAVSLGPAMGWAAAGPHLTYHLAAGDGGVTAFLQHLLTAFEDLWDGKLASWQKLEPQQQRQLTQAIEKAYAGRVEMLREARDRRLSAILRALEQSRAAGPTS